MLAVAGGYCLWMMQSLIAEAVLKRGDVQWESPLSNTGRIMNSQAGTIVTAGCVEYNCHRFCEALLPMCRWLALDT
jgi:hypothetical protein